MAKKLSGPRDPKQTTHRSLAVIAIEIPDSWQFGSATRAINERLRHEYQEHQHLISNKSRLWYRRMRPRARPGLVVHRYELFQSRE
jgi:hypothetical protein